MSKDYLNFLKIKHYLEDSFIEKMMIDRRSIRLLEYITIENLISQKVTVSQVINIERFGSPATIHRSLLKLRDSHLLFFAHKENNFRSKYPTATKITMAYFKILNDAMINSKTHI